MRQVANSIYLASVYPGKLEPIARSYGPSYDTKGGRRTVFKFKPADRFANRQKDRYDVMEIVDSWEDVPNPSKPVIVNNGRMPTDSRLVPCEEIVKDLLKVWCGSTVGLPSGVTPGVMVIANSVPTQAEFEKLEAMQTSFAQYMTQEGDRLYAAKEMKAITPQMRESVKYLGYRRDWSDPKAVINNAECPECRQLIHADQAVCHHCKVRLKPMSPELAALNQPAVQKPAMSAA